MPTYWFNTFSVPVGVCNKLEAIRRSFFWGELEKEGEKNRKIHLLKWEKVLLPKNQGGLGIHAISDKNKGLLGKWRYRWLSDRSSLWNTFIRAKYECSDENDLGSALRGKNVSHILEGLTKINDHNGFDSKISMSNFKWFLKDGNRALFWEDLWYKEERLCVTFVRLYNLSLGKKNQLKHSVTFGIARVQSCQCYGAGNYEHGSLRKL